MICRCPQRKDMGKVQFLQHGILWYQHVSSFETTSIHQCQESTMQINEAIGCFFSAKAAKADPGSFLIFLGAWNGIGLSFRLAVRMMCQKAFAQSCLAGFGSSIVQNLHPSCSSLVPLTSRHAVRDARCFQCVQVHGPETNVRHADPTCVDHHHAERSLLPPCEARCFQSGLQQVARICCGRGSRTLEAR